MDFLPADSNYQEKIRSSFNRQGFMKHIGAELTQIKPGFCEIQLKYNKYLSQQHGYFHAGVIGTLSDNTGGYSAFTLMPADSSILTVEYKMNLLAPGDGECLIARSRVVKAGKTLTICRPEVFVIKDSEETLCATALMTLMQLKGRLDGPKIQD